MCLKELKNKTPISGTDDEINAVTPKRTENDRPRRDKGIIRFCRYCGGRHRRGDCPAYGQTCKKCGRCNHFSQVCQQRNTSLKLTSTNIVMQSHGPNLLDNDSGDSVMTLDLSPQPEEVLVVKGQEFKLKIHMTVKIKGGYEAVFQVDTASTCNVIRAGELRGTKYESKVTHMNQVLKMYNSLPLRPVGKCHVQLTNPQNGKKYKVEIVVVKDNDADISLIGSIAALCMNLIQINHENLLPGSSEVIHAV